MVDLPLSNQYPDISPPWMEGSKEISGHEMIIVHMSEGELEGLDNMQQYPSIDPETGIREYSSLANIIEIPDVRNVFKHVSDEILENGKLSPDLHKVYEYASKYSLPYKPTPEEKHDPLKKAEHTGRDGDTKFALIPLNLALFLIELKGGPSINPKTGLLEFGFFKWVERLGKSIFQNPIRTAGTIVGAMFGGPLGAGLGNTLGSLASGQSLSKSLQTGAMVGGLGYGLQGLGQAAGFLGGAPNLVASGLGSLGIGSAAPIGQAAMAASTAPLASTGVMEAAGAGSAVAPSMMTAAQQAGPVGLMDTIGNFMSKAAPYAPLGVAGLAYMGSKQHRKHKKQESEEEKRYLENERERMGFNRSLPPLPPSTRKYNPRFSERSELERKYGIFPEAAFVENESGRYAKGGLVKSYKKGTLVSGPGKGQDDKIKTSVPDGSYIIDASSTSMFGDGSTKAGSDILKEFENHIKSKFPKRFLKRVEKYVSKTSSQVPVWLSEGEHKIDPVTVTLLGEGSNVNGADILKNMVIKLRKHKISKGDGLPPKAKHPMQYILT
jgi:hypothetical protein